MVKLLKNAIGGQIHVLRIFSNMRMTPIVRSIVVLSL